MLDNPIEYWNNSTYTWRIKRLKPAFVRYVEPGAQPHTHMMLSCLGLSVETWSYLLLFSGHPPHLLPYPLESLWIHEKWIKKSTAVHKNTVLVFEVYTKEIQCIVNTTNLLPLGNYFFRCLLFAMYCICSMLFKKLGFWFELFQKAL